MNGFINAKVLIAILGMLLAVKFLVQPIILWQAGALADISLKSSQQAKVRVLLAQENDLLDLNKDYSSQLEFFSDRLFTNNESLKTRAQEDIVRTITNNGLVVESFSWIVDSPSAPRVIRAKVSYSGMQRGEIAMYLSLGFSPRMYRVLELKNKIEGFRPSKLGFSQGSMVIEVIAFDPSWSDDNE